MWTAYFDREKVYKVWTEPKVFANVLMTDSKSLYIMHIPSTIRRLFVSKKRSKDLKLPAWCMAATRECRPLYSNRQYSNQM